MTTTLTPVWLLAIFTATAVAAARPAAPANPRLAPCLAEGIGIEGLVRWDCHEPWQAYHEADGGFSVEVCGRPALARQVSTSDKTPPWHEVSFLGPLGARVGFRDSSGPATAEQRLDEAVEEMLRQDTSLRRTASRPLQQEGLSGREVDFRKLGQGSGLMVRARLLAGDDRIYRVVVEAHPQSVDCHLIRRFLDSFRLGSIAGAVDLPRDEALESRHATQRFLIAWGACSLLLAASCFWVTRLRSRRHPAPAADRSAPPREAERHTIRLWVTGARWLDAALLWTAFAVLSILVAGAVSAVVVQAPEPRVRGALVALALFGFRGLMMVANRLRRPIALDLGTGGLRLASSLPPAPFGISGVLPWGNIARLGVQGRCVGIVLRDVGAFIAAQHEVDVFFAEGLLSSLAARRSSHRVSVPAELLADNQRQCGFHLLIPASSYPGRAPALLARIEDARQAASVRVESA